jgi:chromosome segregation ATPase
VKFFSSQNAELKTMNRVLTDAARKRSERIEELERQLDHLRQVVARYEEEASNNEAGAKLRLDELAALNRELSEVREAAAERATVINEMNQELAAVRAAAADRAVIMGHELDVAREDITRRAMTINALNQELADVRAATTQYALWAQALDRFLSETGTREAQRRQAWSSFVEPLGVKYRYD